MRPTSGPSGRVISDNERKYYSIERAREVLGYDPRDDSAEYTFGGEPREEVETD